MKPMSCNLQLTKLYFLGLAFIGGVKSGFSLLKLRLAPNTAVKLQLHSGLVWIPFKAGFSGTMAFICLAQSPAPLGTFTICSDREVPIVSGDYFTQKPLWLPG